MRRDFESVKRPCFCAGSLWIGRRAPAADNVLVKTVLHVRRPVVHAEQLAGVGLVFSKKELGCLAVRTRSGNQKMFAEINVVRLQTGISRGLDNRADPAAVV